MSACARCIHRRQGTGAGSTLKLAHCAWQPTDEQRATLAAILPGIRLGYALRAYHLPAQEPATCSGMTARE